jgi:acyl dehydratase
LFHDEEIAATPRKLLERLRGIGSRECRERGDEVDAPGRKLKPGWEGRFFEDFAVGDVYRSRFGRTVTEADNLLFTHVTLNTNPLHFDARYAGETRWGRILVNSTFTLALVVGMSVPDVSENAMANLGWEEVRLPHPVFVGDTLYCETEVLAKRREVSGALSASIPWRPAVPRSPPTCTRPSGQA